MSGIQVGGPIAGKQCETLGVSQPEPIVDMPHPSLDRPGEAALLLGDQPSDGFLVLLEFRIGVSILRDDCIADLG